MKLLIVVVLSHSYLFSQSTLWSINDLSEWEKSTLFKQNISLIKANEWGGVIDLMGNGAMMLRKTNPESLFTHTSNFESSGYWQSIWKDFGENANPKVLKCTVFNYGKSLNMRNGWTKFYGNPVLTGGNTLLPLNKKNLTSQSIVLPKPGGVPQDQAIIRGNGKWLDKWVLLFNHTPDKWPYEYYWSIAVADSLAPLKRGINPFAIDTLNYPLFGPINNQAPNDWLEVDGTIYAPDETYDGESHLWKSENLVDWMDLGVIQGINGSDPGMVFDGKDFYLFNESNNTINYNKLSQEMTSAVYGASVLDVGDHTGDADLGFFNNRWHMFFDDGPHLHYNIGYASTTAETFPLGWKLENDIYGPHIPEQGQLWDDDTSEGNNFGTGDADIALEGITLYMFTERPVGVAYKELQEILLIDSVSASVCIYVDINNDGVANDSTGWYKLIGGDNYWNLGNNLKGNRFKISIKLDSFASDQSPLITNLELLN